MKTSSSATPASPPPFDVSAESFSELKDADRSLVILVRPVALDPFARFAACWVFTESLLFLLPLTVGFVALNLFILRPTLRGCLKVPLLVTSMAERGCPFFDADVSPNWFVGPLAGRVG